MVLGCQNRWREERLDKFFGHSGLCNPICTGVKGKQSRTERQDPGSRQPASFSAYRQARLAPCLGAVRLRSARQVSRMALQ